MVFGHGVPVCVLDGYVSVGVNIPAERMEGHAYDAYYLCLHSRHCQFFDICRRAGAQEVLLLNRLLLKKQALAKALACFLYKDIL